MRENTPPRVPDIEDDEGEVIHFDNDEPPPDDDEEEMIEVTEEELNRMLNNENDEDFYGGSRTPVEDESQLTFSEHKGPVFGCALHPHNDWAATGGEDDKAFVWNTKTGEVIHEIDNHQDTITEVHFSYDGNYLAVGDLAGELEVLRISEPGGEFRKVWEYSMGDMSWLRWHRGANVLLGGSDNGEVYVWRIPSGDCKILPGNGVKCETGELSGDGKKLFVGYTNGVLKLWDLKSCTVLMEVDNQHPLAHEGQVTSVACDKDSPLYMSGGQDDKILFCTNNGPVGSVNASGPVECVAFSPSSELKMAASGTLHGEIAIWDFAKFSLRTLCEHPEMDDGITKMKWLSDYTLLVATIQGNIYAYDARSGVRKFKLSGHMADIYEMQYDPREEILLSVSEDQSAKLFKVPQLGD